MTVVVMSFQQIIYEKIIFAADYCYIKELIGIHEQKSDVKPEPNNF
jgi:hypothetical protein